MVENIGEVGQILSDKLWIARPLKTIRDESTEGYRINIITDDIGKKSLFGGVATSLVFVTLLCEKNNWTLRIITRWAPIDLEDYYNFCKVYGLAAPRKVEGYSDARVGSAVNYRLPVSKNDIFLATSWWSARSIIDSDIAKKFMYIIQEEETFFYPYSDDRYWCDRIMHDRNIDFIINSKLLYDYLKNNGYDELIQNGVYFEPAFPEHLYHPDENTFVPKKDGKKKLFFYGRPMNPRNLYYFGLKCLDEALKRGIIDGDLWDIYLAGYDDGVDGLKFTNGTIAKCNGAMAWDAYAQFARTIDLAFCLMYTPHPSYPPFDMLCSGAVVLTNEFKNKKNLTYSDNLVMEALDVESLMNGFERAIKLASDLDARKDNYENNRICRDWKDSLKDIVDIFEERVKEGKYV